MTKSVESQLLDAYFKKTVELSLGGTALELAVSQTLFSSHDVDTGSMHLLKTLLPGDQGDTPKEGSKILDLGCGYGPLGLYLGRVHPDSEVHLVDRDALAVLFTRHNAIANNVTGARVYASLGYDGVSDRDFDLIVSNIPGKAGETVIETMLLDAQAYLSEEGSVAIVVVTPLEALVEEILTRPEIEILRHETMSAHAVFHYRFTSPVQGETTKGFKSGIYDREALTFVLDDLTLPMQTARGLSEFDTLSYETELLIKALADVEQTSPRQIIAFNPGQGHIPVILWRLMAPSSVDLVDRDLLSLRYAELNLTHNGCPPEAIHIYHQVALAPADASADLLVGILREDEGPEAIEYGLTHAARQLKQGGLCLIGGGSTPVTRVLKSKAIGRYLRPIKRKRSKGNSTALMERR